jgi:hypothetical protein
LVRGAWLADLDSCSEFGLCAADHFFARHFFAGFFYAVLLPIERG